MESIADTLERALACHRAGQLEKAAETYLEVLGSTRGQPQGWQRLLELEPDSNEVRTRMGIALQTQGKIEEAITQYRHALDLNQEYIPAFYNLGNALKDQGKYAEAAACYQRCVVLNANLAEVHNNLGIVLAEQQKLDEATACYQRAIELQQDFGKAHYNLGNVYKDQAKLPEAIASYRRALQLMPDSVETLNNLGSSLKEQALRNPSQQQSGLEEARKCYQRAVDLAPDNAEIRLNLAMICLLTGDFERGWREYEWRCGTKEFAPRYFSEPMWKGESLFGKTILLHAEQGFGDTIQFVRYASLVKQEGSRVILLCQPALTRLLDRCPGIDQVFGAREKLPRFDVHAPLLSLPGLFRTTLNTIPSEVPYIRVASELRDHWAKRLGGMSGLKIGIVWQGSRDHKKDRFRSFPLSCFEPLALMEGVRLFSLQKGPGAEELLNLRGRFQVSDLSLLDFIDSAAAIANLDLVIGCDTSVIHLAGALKCPVWVALSFTPDWRWLLNRTDSPWYPRMRLFRQASPGEWGPVFQDMAESLKIFPGRTPAGGVQENVHREKDRKPGASANAAF